MRNLSIIVIIFLTALNGFSQSPEIISKERAIQIVDSLKKINNQSFKHTIAISEYFTNSEDERNNFFRCLNTISMGFRFPTPSEEEGNDFPWIIIREATGAPSWEEDKSTSLGKKIWIYYYIPDEMNIVSTKVYIGFICSPEMCSTN